MVPQEVPRGPFWCPTTPGGSRWHRRWKRSTRNGRRSSPPLLHAVRRRADFELGLELDTVELALPLFRYRATDANGIVENEVCPVYVATAAGEPDPNPREVAEYRWVDPRALATAVDAAPWAFSPWLVLQARELELFRA